MALGEERCVLAGPPAPVEAGPPGPGVVLLQGLTSAPADFLGRTPSGSPPWPWGRSVFVPLSRSLSLSHQSGIFLENHYDPVLTSPALLGFLGPGPGERV